MATITTIDAQVIGANTQALCDAVATLSTEANGAASGDAIATHTKAAVDGAAGTTTAEFAFGLVNGTFTIGAIKLSPGASLTANDTDYATITIARRRAGASTTLATMTTKITGGSGNWTAWVPLSFTLSASALAAGDVLTFAIAKSGSGVAVPPLVISVFPA